MTRFTLFNAFTDEQLAHSVPRMIEAFGPYHVYIASPVDKGFGAGLVRRHDAAKNHLRQRLGQEDFATLVARLNLFRKTLALHDDVRLPGMEPIWRSELFMAASGQLAGRPGAAPGAVPGAVPIVVPAMLYANILLPGQELALHTDTPEYRGLDKWRVPEWFLVVMHHSGLFEAWRKKVAGGVAFFGPGPSRGGDFVFYADGPSGARQRVPARHGSAIHLDVDSIFHGVERVGGPDAPAPPLTLDMELRFSGDGQWRLGRGDTVVAEYPWHEVRLSLQWKANCYADAREQALVEAHTDDLSEQQVIERLVEDLRERGRIATERPGDTELANLMIDEYIEFPADVI